MNITRRELSEVIAQRTIAERDPERLKQEIAAYLLSEGHIHDLDLIMRDVMTYRLEHGIVEATLVSAHPIDQRIHDDVMDILKEHYPAAQTIVLNERHDPSVIGGVRIDMINQQLDLSVQAKLSTFKRLTSARKD